MKYGQLLEQESVPQWSLHNLDYNSLKHEIKVHTTRDQATAIAIPGQQDTALAKFEERLYQELCNQHERVDLFVTTKADEISRRLDHLARGIRRFVQRPEHSPDPAASFKRHRKFTKYERELRDCVDEIHALTRFANAQVVAFRKIIKKYKKWTGSTTLGARFNQIVLSNPKSFTRRDFNHLQARYDQISRELRSSMPLSDASSPSAADPPTPEQQRTPRRPQVTFEPLPPPSMNTSRPIKYWNEYEDGSEAGDADTDEYAIYINPDEETNFPGFDYINSILKTPLASIKAWFHRHRNPEHQTLLSEENGYGSYGAGYGANISHVDSDEDEYSSNDGLPSYGYMTHYAFPSTVDQKTVRYREKVLLLGTFGCFFASYILLIVTSILILTGKHKLRVEVDAGVTVGVVVSLFCACSALGMMFYRHDTLGIIHRLVVWLAFTLACLLNGMLLVLVVGNSP